MKYAHVFYCKGCGKETIVKSIFRNILYAQPEAPWKLFKKRVRDNSGKLVKTQYHFLCEECNDIKEILE